MLSDRRAPQVRPGVHRILDPLQLLLLRPQVQCGSRQLQKRADQRHATSLGPGCDARQSIKSGATRQGHQYGFELVIGMVGRYQRDGVAGTGDARQGFVAGLAGPGFKVGRLMRPCIRHAPQLWSARGRSVRRKAAALKAHIQGLRLLTTMGEPTGRRRLQLMIDMGRHHASRAPPLNRSMQQHGGIQTP